MEQKTMRIGIVVVILIGVLVTGCPNVSGGDSVTLPAELSDVQNAAADNSVDLLSSIEELVGTSVTKGATVSYDTATGTVGEVKQGSTTAAALAAADAPTEGFDKQFDITFPAADPGAEKKDVEGSLTVSTYNDGSWSVDADDIKFKVEDTDGKASMVGVKYKGTKMNADGELGEGTISVLDALNNDKEIPIDTATINTLKGIGDFINKVNKKIEAVQNPFDMGSITSMEPPVATYKVDGVQAVENPPSTDVIDYDSKVAEYLGRLVGMMKESVTRETIVNNSPTMHSSNELKTAGVDATISTGFIERMVITKPDTNTTKYLTTMIYTIAGTLELTESGKTQTIEFVDVKQTSVFSQIVNDNDNVAVPAIDTIPKYKVRYTGSIKFNGVELKLNNGKMKYLLSFQESAMKSMETSPGN